MDKTNIFIEKARKIHGDEYDYSQVNYIGVMKNVHIICHVHGLFAQTPNTHLNGSGCRNCVPMKLREKFASNKETFIQKAREIHGDKYDYSQVEYVNSQTKVKIICPLHGIFEQIPNNHIGKGKGKGCAYCGVEKNARGQSLTTEKFIENCRQIHGNEYDYSKVEYKNNYTPVTIICPNHGEFQQTPTHHQAGNKCSKCGHAQGGMKLRVSTEDFIEKAKKIHGDKYSYEKTIYVKAIEPVTIICKVHGEFQQLAISHASGKGCKHCKFSRGEAVISDYLRALKIDFEPQKRFDTCKNINILPFDFYLPKFDVLIEYDGEQHYKARDFFGGEEGLELRQRLDGIKTEWAKNNNKPLLRIRYDEYILERLMTFLDPYITEL